MKKNKQFVFFLILLTCVAFDQITKIFIDNTLYLNQNLVILKNVLSFEKLYNSGAAFSIMQNNTLLLILISVITVFFILIFILKKTAKLSIYNTCALAFISGGAIGNLIDRIFNSYVIDFIQLDFINFPVFNFADIFINIGVIILVVSIFICKNNE